MTRDLSSTFYDLASRPSLESLKRAGGLSQLSLQGGSATRAALACLGNPQDVARADPPSPTNPDFYALWAADEGWLYAPALHHGWNIPLSRLLMVKVPDPMDVWRLALEAIQTGLFQWAFLRPSRLCPDGHLRKLQLTAESNRCQVFVLSDRRLPHWVLKKQRIQDAHSLPKTLGAPHDTRGSLSRTLP